MNLRRHRQQDEVSINLTPLIDVVLLLLIFFMVATTFTRETRLGVVLPQADGTPGLQDAEGIEVVITAGNEYRVNGELLPRADEVTLRAALAPLAEQGAEQPFTITADAHSSHQAVVRVMDVAGQVGFVQLRITTQEPTGETP